MANLNQLASTDYNPYFRNIMQNAEAIPTVGESIPKGDFGQPKYQTSMTPIQQKRAISVGVLVLGVLGTATFLTLALVSGRPTFYYVLIPTGATVVGGGIATYYYMTTLDLDSPKTREEETKKLREKRLTLRGINERYDGGVRVAAYRLLGNAKNSDYQSVANLCAVERAAHNVRERHVSNIEHSYQETIRPARENYDRVRRLASMVQGAGTGAAVARDSGTLTRIAGVGAVAYAAHEEGQALQIYRHAISVANPLREAALNKLQSAYDSAMQVWNHGFSSLTFQPDAPGQGVQQ